MRLPYRSLLLPVVVVALTPAAASGAACTPTHAYQFAFTPQGVPYFTTQYENCSVADLDQRRIAGSGGHGGLPNSGHMYCVPTAAMDWMAWLSKWGYIVAPLGLPPDKDWTDPANFNEMSRYLDLMGGYMGTDPTHGTNGGGFTSGLQYWLARYALGHKQVGAFPFVSKVFQRVNSYDPDPNAMGLDAAGGALVMVNIGFYDSSGSRAGGHEVAYQEGLTDTKATGISIQVMDPNKPAVDDHVQSAYSRDVWVLSPAPGTNGLWSIGNSIYNPATTFYDGYSAIEPEYVFSADAPTMVVDKPFTFTETRRHRRSAQRVKLPSRRRVIDFAVAPEGFTEPFLQRGTDKVLQVNTLTGSTSTLALGPKHPSHLTFGGPAQTLFVAGAHQLIALDRTGRRIASAKLAHPLDALAYDDHAGRLVALSTAQRRVFFFSPTLHSQGSARISASLLHGSGAPTLAVARDGSLLIHRDDEPYIAIAKPAAHATATTVTAVQFQALRLQTAPRPGGLAVDDRGHLFFSVHGRLVELLPNGRPARRSFFTGMPADGIVRVSRSFSNAAPNVRFQ